MENYFVYKFSIGKILVAEEKGYITKITFSETKISLNSILRETPLIKKAKEELEEYFVGKRKKFSIPIKPQGTKFQERVWQAIMKIPYGKTCSYKDIAIKIGNSKAARAIGGANNKNPIAIIIPCHRVIGTNGTLTGYAGGLKLKKKLLFIEEKNFN